MSTFTKLLVVGYGVLVVFFIMAFVQYNAELTVAKTQYVMSACQGSRQSCGDAEDATNSEFLCKSANVTSDCWVEFK